MEPPKRRKYIDTNEFRMKCIEFYRASNLSLPEASHACKTSLGTFKRWVRRASEVAVRCETNEGKKSKVIGTKRPRRKPLSEDLEQRLKAFVLKQQV